MVWNGVPVDLSRLVGSGRNERPDLRFAAFWDVGRDSFHGIDGIWRWSACGLCGGHFKSTSLGNLDASARSLKGIVIFLVFGVGEGKSGGDASIRPRERVHSRVGLYRYDVSQMPRENAG